MKTIVLTAAAAKQFDELVADVRQQIVAALDRYAMDGVGDVKKLAGRSGLRMPIGRYRVLFDEDHNVVLAIYIGKRETTTYHRN